MTKWEYKEECISDPRENDEVINLLNERGADGWELFEKTHYAGCVSYGSLPKLVLLFKREIEPD